MFSCDFCEIFKNIYFANVREGLPLNCNISAGVSFCKGLVFYYKHNRKLFYHEGTSPYIRLKISERVNRVILGWDVIYRDVIWVSLQLTWKTVLKSVTESEFCKSSGPYYK